MMTRKYRSIRSSAKWIYLPISAAVLMACSGGGSDDTADTNNSGDTASTNNSGATLTFAKPDGTPSYLYSQQYILQGGESVTYDFVNEIDANLAADGSFSILGYNPNADAVSSSGQRYCFRTYPWRMRFGSQGEWLSNTAYAALGLGGCTSSSSSSSSSSSTGSTDAVNGSQLFSIGNGLLDISSNLSSVSSSLSNLSCNLSGLSSSLSSVSSSLSYVSSSLSSVSSNLHISSAVNVGALSSQCVIPNLPVSSSPSCNLSGVSSCLSSVSGVLSNLSSVSSALKPVNSPMRVMSKLSQTLTQTDQCRYTYTGSVPQYPMKVGAKWNYGVTRICFSESQTRTEQGELLGLETLNLPNVGTRQAMKLNITITSSFGTGQAVRSGTRWVTPETGLLLKETATTVFYGVSSVSASTIQRSETVLKAINLP